MMNDQVRLGGKTLVGCRSTDPAAVPMTAWCSPRPSTLLGMNFFYGWQLIIPLMVPTPMSESRQVTPTIALEPVLVTCRP